MEQSARISIFNIGSSLLLLTAHISRKRYISEIVLLYYMIAIFLNIVNGRRGSLMEDLILLFFMIMIRLRSSLVNRTERYKIYFSSLIIIILFLTFDNVLMSSYVFERGFDKNAFIESRGRVFEDFFYDFKSTDDWIFGRGLDGTILRTINLEEEHENFIENGFLTALLKGGLI
jgi:hypothetical protein